MSTDTTIIKTEKYSEEVEALCKLCRIINREIGSYRYHALTKEGDFNVYLENGTLVLPLQLIKAYSKDSAANISTQVLACARLFKKSNQKKKSSAYINEAWKKLFREGDGA